MDSITCFFILSPFETRSHYIAHVGFKLLPASYFQLLKFCLALLPYWKYFSELFGDPSKIFSPTAVGIHPLLLENRFSYFWHVLFEL